MAMYEVAAVRQVNTRPACTAPSVSALSMDPATIMPATVPLRYEKMYLHMPLFSYKLKTAAEACVQWLTAGERTSH